MPSVQWGSTNNAHFVWTPISAALANLPNGAGTIAALWKPASVSGEDGCGLTSSGNPSPGAWYHALGVNTTPHWNDDDGSVNVDTATTPNATDWYISVVDWPAGATAAAERFHIVDQTTAGAWSHANSSVNNSGNRAGPGTGGWFRVGYFGDDVEPSGMQIALVGVWAGVQLGDTNAALLNANKRTSDWYNNPAGTPTFLAEITTLAPTDLISGNSFSSANSTTTGLTVGGNPAGGWTFDGIGFTADNSTKPARPGMFTPDLNPTAWF